MAVITWGVIGLILGLVGGAIGPGRGLTKWAPGIMIGICTGLLIGWLGALVFRVSVRPIFEPVSAACAAVGAVVALAWWLVVKFRYRARALRPGHDEPEELPDPPNAPM
jgi:uncharacterized membrane protein YeaQ/YmgE (transglycosylase-associated protein family)